MRIAIEGLIGVGKSTVLKHLESSGFEVQLEPLQDWSLLQQFYANQARNAAAFEAQVLASYCHDKFAPRDILMERSPDSAFGVFAKMLHQEGLLSGSGLALIREMYHTLPIHKADAFVYICASAEVCMSRMQWRARGSESNVSLEYLTKLNEAYKHFFMEDPRPHVFVTLDGSENPGQVCNMVRAAIVHLNARTEGHHIVVTKP